MEDIAQWEARNSGAETFSVKSMPGMLNCDVLSVLSYFLLVGDSGAVGTYILLKKSFDDLWEKIIRNI